MHEHQADQADNAKSKQELLIEEYNIPLTLASADSFRGFFRKVRNLVGDLGFSDFSITYFNSQSAGCEPFSTMSLSLMRDYQEGGFFQYDCSLEYTSNNKVVPIFKSSIDKWIAKCPVQSDYVISNAELLKLSRSYGYADHYLMPLKSLSKNTNFLFTVSNKNANIIQFREAVMKYEKELMTIAVAADYIGSNRFSEDLFGRQEESTIRIPNRPLQALSLMANHDLNIKDVAQMMHISERTAKKYISTAKNALGCKKLNRAIAKAICEGLIKIRDTNHDWNAGGP